MRQKKMKQLRRALANKMDENGTKFITREQYRSAPKKIPAVEVLYDTYRKYYNDAKRRYAQANCVAREQVGKEWRQLVG